MVPDSLSDFLPSDISVATPLLSHGKMWVLRNVTTYLAMVTIPPKKVVMTGVWFMALFYPHYINPTLETLGLGAPISTPWI
jgi:hypothetical protein